MSLEVLEVPSFVKVPTSQVYFTAKTVRFECEVKDNRTTEVVWLKNGKRLQINGLYLSCWYCSVSLWNSAILKKL
jgi:hypothetical protein